MYDFLPILARIKEAKNNLGFTNEDLSLKSGVAIGTINKIMSGGTKEPKLPALMSIASALGVSVDYLIYGTKQQEAAATVPEAAALLLSRYDNLNEAGKEELLNYAEYLTTKAEYKKRTQSNVVSKEA